MHASVNTLNEMKDHSVMRNCAHDTSANADSPAKVNERALANVLSFHVAPDLGTVHEFAETAFSGSSSVLGALRIEVSAPSSHRCNERTTMLSGVTLSATARQIPPFQRK
jgi:hypothetical protein